jgi:hypothetical protein
MSACRDGAAVRALVLAALTVLVCNCSRAPERATMELAGVRVSVEVPARWRHVNLGRRHVLQREEARIAFQEVSPAGRDRIRREVESARVLAREGRLPDAQVALSKVKLPRDLFPTEEFRAAFFEAWSHVTQSRGDAPLQEVDIAFGRLLEAVGSLPDRDSAMVEREVLAQMGADERVEVGSREWTQVGGRDALVFHTWSGLTHDPRGRQAIVFLPGTWIGIWTDMGAPTDTAPIFEQILRSLRFEDQGAEGARTSSVWGPSRARSPTAQPRPSAWTTSARSSSPTASASIAHVTPPSTVRSTTDRPWSVQ